MRESDGKTVTVLPGDFLAPAASSPLGLRAGNTINLENIPDHGITTAKRYNVEATSFNEDATISLECREDLDGTYGVTLGADSVYRISLAPPPLLGRPLEFGNSVRVPAMSGFSTSFHAETQADGIVLNYIRSTWAEEDAFEADVDYRRRQSIWNAPVDVKNGVYYRVTGMRPFTAYEPGDTNPDWPTNQSQRWGWWLQYRGGDVGSHLLEARWSQMAGGGDTGAPEYPILNSAPGGGETRNIKFRRFGVLNALATPFGARRNTVMEFNYAGGNEFATNYRFTAAQERDWRIHLRDSGGNSLTIQLPSETEDPDNPFRWLDNDSGLLTSFLRTAITGLYTVDVAVTDSAVAAYQASTKSVLVEGTNWIPMPATENSAVAPGAVEGDTYETRGRLKDLNERGPYVLRTDTVTGDLAPPRTPTGLVATSAPGGGRLEWIPVPDPDVEGYEILTSATSTGTYTVLDETKGPFWKWQGLRSRSGSSGSSRSALLTGGATAAPSRNSPTSFRSLTPSEPGRRSTRAPPLRRLPSDRTETTTCALPPETRISRFPGLGFSSRT